MEVGGLGMIFDTEALTIGIYLEVAPLCHFD